MVVDRDNNSYFIDSIKVKKSDSYASLGVLCVLSWSFNDNFDCEILFMDELMKLKRRAQMHYWFLDLLPLWKALFYAWGMLAHTSGLY